MMPTIRIDDDVWRFLQTKAKPFEDTPNDVLRRELGLDHKGSPQYVTPADQGMPRASARFDPVRRVPSEPLTADKDYTRHTVRGYRLDGRLFPARSFKDILIGLSTFLLANHPDKFQEAALSLHGKKRPYFSRRPEALRLAERLSDSDVFAETNLNANLIVGICRRLLEKLGYNLETFQIE